MLLQSVADFFHWKMGQVVLQSRAGITKLGNFHHKVRQLLQSMAVQTQLFQLFQLHDVLFIKLLKQTDVHKWKTETRRR